jgi:mono/diheme cytochrome c family protein
MRVQSDLAHAIAGCLSIGVLALAPHDASVQAQVGPDAAKGRALAEKLCVSCHIVAEKAANATVSADVPSFVSIANKPGQTAEAIAGRIVLPHPPMPKIQLTRSEIADIATYISSLKAP